jgi:hypothetical protein
MADETVDIDVNINTNTEQAEGNFTRLQSQIRETTRLLQAAEAAGDQTAFKGYKKQLDELEDKLEITNLKQKQLDDTLAAAPGPLGKAGAAVKGLDGAFKFLLANPIVALIAAVASALLGMKKALESTKEGQDTLNRVSQAFSKILGPLLAIVEKVALPIFNSFAFILEKVAAGFNKFATFLGISSSKIKEATLSVDKVQQEANKKEDERQKEAQQKREQAEKDRIAKQKQAAEERRKAKEEELKTIDAGEKEAFLILLDAREKEEYQVNEKYAKLIFLAIKHKRDITSLREAQAKELAAIDKKYDAEEEKAIQSYFTKISAINVAAIEEEAERNKQARRDKYRQDLIDLEADKNFIKESDASKAFIRQNLLDTLNRDLTKIDDDKRKKDKDARLKQYDDELKFLQIRQEGLTANTISYFDNQREILRVAYEKEIFDAEDNAKKKIEIEKRYQQAKKDLRDQEIAAYGAVASATISSLAAVTGALAAGYDEEAKTSKAAFEKRKKLQKATALLSAASGIIQILTQPSTLPSPFDFIVKGLNAAALAITTGIQLKNIDKVQFESAGGSSSLAGGSTASTPSFSAPSIGAPQIGASASQQGQLAGIVAGALDRNNSQGRPLRAYVVGNDITSEQQLQRRLRTAARLGG